MNHDGIDPGYVYMYSMKSGPLKGSTWIMNNGPSLRISWFMRISVLVYYRVRVY
jgi:hypothetical protein